MKYGEYLIICGSSNKGFIHFWNTCRNYLSIYSIFNHSFGVSFLVFSIKRISQCCSCTKTLYKSKHNFRGCIKTLGGSDLAPRPHFLSTHYLDWMLLPMPSKNYNKALKQRLSLKGYGCLSKMNKICALLLVPAKAFHSKDKVKAEITLELWLLEVLDSVNFFSQCLSCYYHKGHSKQWCLHLRELYKINTRWS